MRKQIRELGILPIDKPSGMTSHDVVARVRKTLGIRKVGHAGTLDPLATGVLVICVGRATRLAQYLTGQQKRYTARIRLGVETDTLDADGEVTATSDRLPDSIEEIETIAESFRGKIEQTPPMYSARKVDGERLHRLARAGKVVERESREIEIHSLVIREYDPPFVDIDVICSKGTYIRSLAADLGSALGCGASVETLRRTESGSITERDCTALDDLERETAREKTIDPNQALQEMPSCVLPDDQIDRFSHGNPVPISTVASHCRVSDEAGAFWGIGQATEGVLRPLCVLRDAEVAREAHSP